MSAPSKTLTDLRVRDLMRTDVFTLSEDDTLSSAVSSFEAYRLGGAPVLGAGRTVVGFLSASDIVRSEHLEAGRLATEGRDDGSAELQAFVGEYDEILRSDFVPEVESDATVKDWMSEKVVSVTPDEKLKALCKLFVDESIHRVPVVEGGRLVGIVSTTDVVRSLAERL